MTFSISQLDSTISHSSISLSDLDEKTINYYRITFTPQHYVDTCAHIKPEFGGFAETSVLVSCALHTFGGAYPRPPSVVAMATTEAVME